MKKLLLSVSAVLFTVNILAQPVAQNVTLIGTNGTLSPISSTLTSYATGNPPLFFNVVSQMNGFTMLNPSDGSFTFTPTSLPASFNYNVTDTHGIISNTATVTIVPGPMISTTTDFETDIG